MKNFLFLLAVVFLFIGCSKEKAIVLNSSDEIMPDQEWVVVKVPYVAFMEKAEYNSEVKSRARSGDVFLIQGKEFVKKENPDEDDKKKQKALSVEFELWYKFESGYLPSSQVDVYDTKLKALRASRQWKADN